MHFNIFYFIFAPLTIKKEEATMEFFSEDYAISKRMDRVFANEPTTVVQEFIAENRKQKKDLKEAIPFLIDFMETHQDRFLPYLNRHNSNVVMFGEKNVKENIKKSLAKYFKNYPHQKFTLQRLIEIAEGWDPTELDELLDAAVNDNIVVLFHTLLNF